MEWIFLKGAYPLLVNKPTATTLTVRNSTKIIQGLSRESFSTALHSWTNYVGPSFKDGLGATWAGSCFERERFH